jgi:hypothetical protein
MKNYLKTAGCTRCPKCKKAWEHLPGKAVPGQKTEDGKLLSP